MRYLLLITVCLTLGVANAQEVNLPKSFAKGEKEMMSNYLENLSPSGNSEPPINKPRSLAEWEEMQGVFISWKSYQSILKEIVRFAQDEAKVYITAADTNNVKNYLTTNGIDNSKNINYISYNSNSVWMRDYGPNSIYLDGVDSLALLDWIYNRPRPLDDSFSSKAASVTGLEMYQTIAPPYDMVHTGGNFMSDGMGKAFSSELVLEENGPNNNYGFSNQSEDDIKNILEKYMGITEYVLMQALPYDGINHIDMHMKLLDETTLLVGQYPTGISDGPQIEANIQYVLSNYTSSFGVPYRVIRIPMPPDQSGKFPNAGGDYRTFANALILNKTVILPVYEQKFDTTAVRIWKEAMPGYKIQTIDCDPMISASGAIHCITKELGAAQPLLIQHARLSEVDLNEFPGGYVVNARISHASGIQSASMYYRLQGDIDWNLVEMEKIASSIHNEWEALIPSQVAGTEIEYYISAIAVSGKFQVRPITAPEGFYSFKVEGTTSSTEIAESFTEKLFPNPASANTCIPVVIKAGTKIQLSLLDVMGRNVVQIFDGEQGVTKQNYFINASNLEAGVYFVQLQANGYSTTQLLNVK